MGATERRRVARLLQRAGFGASVAEIDKATANGYAATVDQLLSYSPRASDVELQAQALLSGTQSNTFHGGQWWLGRMATTMAPLEEKLTLYWHGHFASTFKKVADMNRMLQQNDLLRTLGGGNFRTLANAVTANEAMLIFLDGTTNEAGKPNENYGREFMELFTLGRNRYTQVDVKQAARCFTGYTLDGSGTGHVDPARHDNGQKTLLGQTGNWGPLDVSAIILDHHPDGPVSAYYVATRMAKFFHHPAPEPAVVNAMATAFLQHGYEIKPMLRALFLRPEFMDGPVLTIKSPAELVAGIVKALGLNTNLDITAAEACAAMGQELFNPPGVAGWGGGRAWANTATTLARYNYAASAAQQAVDAMTNYADALLAGTTRATVSYWTDRLGILELLPSTQAAIADYMDYAKTVGHDEAATAHGLLTILLASPDVNLR